MSTDRPLEGIRILDLSRLLPGPYLTMVLADLGADVVKVEDPRVGDYLRQIPPARGGISGRFTAVNRGKRSLALDLKTDAGREAFLDMVEKADVVVESFRPGVMKRLGIDYDALVSRRADIILCSISGYGQTGPYVARAGHDLNYVALAGVLAMGGMRGGAPILPGVQIADIAGGALWGVAGVLSALFGRERGRGGRHLDISMTEGALALLGAELGSYDCDGQAPTRGIATLNGGIAGYAVYETKDGKYLAVGALEPKFWMAFNAAIGRTGDMADIIAPPEKQETIRSEIQEIMKTKTRDEWAAHLQGFDCCTEPVLEMEELADHPLHVERGMFVSVDAGEAGTIRHTRTPLAAPNTDRPAPGLGEHSREVLAEYGFAEERISSLLGQ